MEQSDKIKIIIKNRKANYQFEILDKYEAGIVLLGTEVKSLRESKANLNDAYARIIDNEIWLINCHISEYKYGNYNNHEPLRNRKLLFNKREIRKIKSKLNEKGLTMIPLSMYFKGSVVKVELATAKGKNIYDKREAIKKRELIKKLKKI